MEEVFMTNEERDIQRKLSVLQHAEKIGNARKACRYFGVGRTLLHKSAYDQAPPFPGRNYPTATMTGMPSAV